MNNAFMPVSVIMFDSIGHRKNEILYISSFRYEMKIYIVNYKTEYAFRRKFIQQ